MGRGRAPSDRHYQASNEQNDSCKEREEACGFEVEALQGSCEERHQACDFS